MSILLRQPAYAADTETPGQADSAADLPSGDTEALLRQVEDQVLKGQLLAPPDDNAFQTWERVLARVSSGSADQLHILSGFLVHIRQKILSEQAAGNVSRSVELMLFADQAERILGIDQPQPAPPTTTAQDASPPAPSPAPLPQVADRSPSPSTDMAPAPVRRPSPSIAPELEASVTPPRQVVRPAPAQDPSAAALYTSKGDALIAIKDISAARKFYEYGANAGSARAALALARTYDPTFLPKLGAIGLASDLALAETWYQRAAELGEPGAQLALQRFKADTGR